LRVCVFESCSLKKFTLARLVLYSKEDGAY
jgi:hypothetical protein